VSILENLPEVEIAVYEPTDTYQNVAKREGIEKLTPARALISELVRRYMLIGIDCTLLEVQKLAYFLELKLKEHKESNPLDLRFQANRFGPYAYRLGHLLNQLDGSYLHCEKRLGDAGPLDLIWFDYGRKDKIDLYLRSEAKSYKKSLDETTDLIDGFESPLGMELLATVDWLLRYESALPDVESLKNGLKKWTGGTDAGIRKLKLFDDRLLSIALARLRPEVATIRTTADTL
jgi:hypothetical protein